MTEASRFASSCPFSSSPADQVGGEAGFRELIEAAPDAIILVDGEGTITYVNSQTQNIFGYQRDDLVGQKIELLLPVRFRENHLNHRRNFNATPRVRAMGAGLELFGLRKDGTEFPVEISLSPLKTTNGFVVLSAIRDVTARVQIESRLRASLAEKEVLLKEVHHRVKNNLQVISSLLNFQADAITDTRMQAIFQDARTRIKSIALIHERLYQTDDFSHIDFAEYVNGLLDDLFHSYGVERERISVVVDVDPVILDVDALVNCGLIVGELVSNTLKYAFPDNRSGQVKISLKNENSRNVLRVSDNGVGMPAIPDAEQRSSLGLKLVKGLARELGGMLEIRQIKGVEFVINFPQGRARSKQ